MLDGAFSLIPPIPLLIPFDFAQGERNAPPHGLERHGDRITDRGSA